MSHPRRRPYFLSGSRPKVRTPTFQSGCPNDDPPYFSDAFDRPDASLAGTSDGNGHECPPGGSGFTFTPQLGTGLYEIESNELKYSSSGGNGERVLAADQSISSADFYAETEIRLGSTTAASENYGGLVFRYLSRTNHWYASISHEESELQLRKVVGGVDTKVASDAITPSTGTQTLEVRAEGQTIVVQLGGVRIEANSQTDHQTETGFGFRAGQDNVVAREVFWNNTVFWPVTQAEL